MDGLFEAAALIPAKDIGLCTLILVGNEFWKGLRDFVGFMSEQGVFSSVEIGFYKIVDTSGKAVGHMLKSLPPPLTKELVLITQNKK